MSGFLRRVTTPFTFGLFLVSAISGVLMFFRLGMGIVVTMHEWLSIALLVPFGLHVWKHWDATKSYFRRNAMTAPLLLSLVAALAFIVPAMMHGGRSPREAVVLLTRTPLDKLAPVVKTTPDVLRNNLVQRGYQVASLNATLNDIAMASGAPVMKLLIEVLPLREGANGQGRSR